MHDKSIDLGLTPCIEISFKWIKYLNIRLETLKAIEEMLGDTTQYKGVGNSFLTTIAQGIKVRIHKWDYMK